MILRIIRTAEETKGQSLEMEWEILPQADGTPVHLHPEAQETYRVLEGQIEVNVNGEWHHLHQGEEITVPAGIPHTFRNPTDYITKVYNTHSPAMQFDNYFKDLNKVVARLSAQGHQKLEPNFNTITYMSMLMKKYPKEIVSVSPPDFIVSLLNLIGKARRLEV
ncbi:cupin domain-containing protein [Pontibacter sp. KCTC 32443]|uniref:cupin domain-containing protein n=1 Tax=Pontibacter TaxID=323449 RepID=UPI00164DA7A0|nr:MULTISPECIES: cupin domain-containing protein [Pontibacter]MBC5774870.1 cupin domain-containing protein [Pontibacter sp. KCTC 32443]